MCTLLFTRPIFFRHRNLSYANHEPADQDHDTRPDPAIEDDQIIPHNKTYTSLLSKSNFFKRKLIQYSSDKTDKFLEQSAAVTTKYTTKYIIILFCYH